MLERKNISIEKKIVKWVVISSLTSFLVLFSFSPLTNEGDTKSEYQILYETLSEKGYLTEKEMDRLNSLEQGEIERQLASKNYFSDIKIPTIVLSFNLILLIITTGAYRNKNTSIILILINFIGWTFY